MGHIVTCFLLLVAMQEVVFYAAVAPHVVVVGKERTRWVWRHSLVLFEFG